MYLLGTGHQRAAKLSRVLVGTTALTYASWKATLEGDDLETTNFESYNVATGQSFSEGILGILKSNANFGGDWDAGTNPYGSPPSLYPQDGLANLYLYTSRIDGIYWQYPYFRVRSSEVGASVKEKVTFNCSGMNQGPFSYPTGEAAN